MSNKTISGDNVSEPNLEKDVVDIKERLSNLEGGFYHFPTMINQSSEDVRQHIKSITDMNLVFTRIMFGLLIAILLGLVTLITKQFGILDPISDNQSKPTVQQTTSENK